MKKSKILFIMFLASFFAQTFYFGYAHKESLFTFSMGLPREYNDLSIMLDILFLVSPTIFMLFFFSGSLQEITEGYGKLLMIRNYSRTKLLLRELFKNLVMIVIISFIEVLTIAILSKNSAWLSDRKIILSLIAYPLAKFSVVLTMLLAELFFNPHLAGFAVSIYVCISCYIAQCFSRNIIIRAVFFPSMIFGFNNMADGHLSEFLTSLAVILFINILLILIEIQKIKKKDIF